MIGGQRRIDAHRLDPGHRTGPILDSKVRGFVSLGYNQGLLAKRRASRSRVRKFAVSRSLAQFMSGFDNARLI